MQQHSSHGQRTAAPNPPEIIVVDTLHRFLDGDENSAADAKSMLDACAALINEFGASVILVHHTGVNAEAQHRARGSSAWRGALDVEISVVPGETIEIIQRKSKDAEEAAPAMKYRTRKNLKM
jgi:putative DNA primase/helicase